MAGPEVGHSLDGIDLQRLFGHLTEELLEGGRRDCGVRSFVPVERIVR
ncbi:hypothetical protein ACK8N7_01210 [Streptomyces griseobrunneus]